MTLLVTLKMFFILGGSSISVKIDAVPGRLNQVNLYINYPGLFTGQCSELCGTLHGLCPSKFADFESANLGEGGGKVKTLIQEEKSSKIQPDDNQSNVGNRKHRRDDPTIPSLTEFQGNLFKEDPFKGKRGHAFPRCIQGTMEETLERRQRIKGTR
jgi:hypothetical protein